MKTILRKLRPGKTLVYFASGTKVSEEFSNLPYENVILVDKNFRGNSYDGKKIFCLKGDSIRVAHALRKRNIVIDCFVVLNEGLFEGGGNYALNSDSFLGYCFPLFADTIVHLGCPSYYSGGKYAHLREHYLDLPYLKKIRLGEGEEGYLDPAIFSGIKREVFVNRLEHKVARKVEFEEEGIACRIKHGSIWADIDELDAAVLRYEDDYQKKIMEACEPKAIAIKDETHVMYPLDDPKVSYRGGYEIPELVAMSIEKGWKSIGFVPRRFNCRQVLKQFAKANSPLQEITFYHLNAGDYSEYYQE